MDSYRHEVVSSDSDASSEEAAGCSAYSSSATVCTWQAEAEAGHHDHNAQDEGHNGSRILCSWY